MLTYFHLSTNIITITYPTKHTQFLCLVGYNLTHTQWVLILNTNKLIFNKGDIT